MANKSWSSVRGKVARVTKVNDSGVPQAGACGTVVTDGFVSVSYAPEISEGEEIEVKKANGAICVSDKACDSLRWITTEVQFCGVDPAVFSTMTGQPVVTDHAGNLVGIRIGQAISCEGAYGLELWSDVPGAFDPDTGDKQYGYFVTPSISNGVLQDFTLENDAATFTVSGTTKAAPGWGTGPYDVDSQDAAGTPGPLLTPFGATDHMDMHLTSIAPPAVTDGCEALTLPVRYTADTDSDGVVDAYDTTP